MNRRTIVSVIGNAACASDGCSDEDKFKWWTAYELGKTLVDNGYRVLTGGGLGVMRAVMMGAHASENYREGDTIALAPSYDHNMVNDCADIVIPTGIDFYRDTMVANSEVVIAVGGGSGTLNEMSAAWKLGRLLICYKNIEGWSSRLAGEPMDNHVRYTGFKDQVFGVETAEEAVEVIKKMLPKYDCCFDRLPLGAPKLIKKAKCNWIGPNPYPYKKIKKLLDEEQSK